MSLAAVPVYLLARRLSLSAGYALACASSPLRSPTSSSRATRSPTPSRSRSRSAPSMPASSRCRARRDARRLAFFVPRRARHVRPRPVRDPPRRVPRGRSARRPPEDRAHAAAAARALRAAAALARSRSARRACSATTRTSSTCTSAAGSCTGPSSTRSCSGSRRASFCCRARSSRLPARAGGPRRRSPPSPPCFAAGLLFEAALYASNGSERFQERYLFALLPLAADRVRALPQARPPGRLAVALGSLGFFALATRFPVSGYAAALGKTDSPFLSAVFRLEQAIGNGNGALVVSLLAVGARSARLRSRGSAAAATRSAARSRSWRSRHSARRRTTSRPRARCSTRTCRRTPRGSTPTGCTA